MVAHKPYTWRRWQYYIDRKPTRNTVDWVTKQWRPNHKESTVLIHFDFEPKEKKGGSGTLDKTEKKNWKIKFKVIQWPALDLIEQHINRITQAQQPRKTCSTFLKPCKLQMGPFSTLMQAKRHLRGELQLGSKITTKKLNNNLLIWLAKVGKYKYTNWPARESKTL